MKLTPFRLPLALIVVLGLAGCATPSLVTLQNGTQYLTQDRPSTTNRDGFYEFVDIAGKHIKVRAEDVTTIKTDS